MAARWPQVDPAGKLFSATKVWTAFERVGPTQMAESLRLWKLARFDLMQIHNRNRSTGNVGLHLNIFADNELGPCSGANLRPACRLIPFRNRNVDNAAMTTARRSHGTNGEWSGAH